MDLMMRRRALMGMLGGNDDPNPLLNKYIAFKAIEAGTFSFSNSGLFYSLDAKNWTSLTANTPTPVIQAGRLIYFKGELTSAWPNGCGTFSSTAKFDVMGNILSLLLGDNADGVAVIPSNYAYCNLFKGCTMLVNANRLLLNATSLRYACYYGLFEGCTSLVTAPALPSNTIVGGVYQRMFFGCTSLTTAPMLPATTIAGSCYGNMFEGCTSLVNAPDLPAITLEPNCYTGMFANCTSLTKAPTLPATFAKATCYSTMFKRCTSLVNVPDLNITSFSENGNNFCLWMFEGCTSLINAPALPATTLNSGCYWGMFANCTSLVNAPELPATTLVTNCYREMFKNCINLKYVKAMFTTTPESDSTLVWLQNVASSGTFVKNSAATWDVTGVSGVPSGWTVQTADN